MADPAEIAAGLTKAHVRELRDAAFALEKLLVPGCGFGPPWMEGKDAMIARLRQVADAIDVLQENTNG